MKDNDTHDAPRREADEYPELQAPAECFDNGDDEIGFEDEEELAPRRRRRRILRSASALPSLVTLGNGIAGFAAIHLATKPLPPAVFAAGQDEAHAWVSANLVRAAWLIFVGMICDALDGQLARLTAKTSRFGAELDSLCDAISFAVAPAILMLRAVQAQLFPFVGEVDVLPHTDMIGRTVWFIAAVYAACGIMRLARFNVESDDESMDSHMDFMGLPSPAAALSVVSLVLLHSHLLRLAAGTDSAAWINNAVMWCMPAFTLAGGLLMVSRIRFPHLVNQLLYGKRSFNYLVTLAILLLSLLVIRLEIVLAVASSMFVLIGPVGWLWRTLWGRRGASKRPA